MRAPILKRSIRVSVDSCGARMSRGEMRVQRRSPNDARAGAARAPRTRTAYCVRPHCRYNVPDVAVPSGLIVKIRAVPMRTPSGLLFRTPSTSGNADGEPEPNAAEIRSQLSRSEVSHGLV